MEISLQGRVALVTGGSRGIGRAICLRLAEAGASVAVNYAGNAQAAEEVASIIKAQGGQAITVQANVADAGEVAGMFDMVLNTYGKIDILVNNAGITRDNLLIRMKDEEWDAVIDTNLKGVYQCIKAAAKPMMKQRYGRIVNISSVVGLIGNAGQMNYVAAKAGVIGMTKTAAREFSSRNISVNAVAPGFIETDMTATLSEDIKTKLYDQIPLGRLGQADDVAKAVLFLASDDSGYMTGQTLHVDGGMVM